ncbi:type II toxin-antitoxin system HicB family antitoxin [Alicyclobacillus sp. ALC3]|uniref:type II toxin-antitoxin system HicB family antitoxin n=1 Tax=Alicyclobacillus sp. ALC3 TaxID=2796143 RepID=UPI0023793B2B|nr:type II toxin-antitoxin system HicB family antitoxin [Alicyclobacillus sp. ALC3]
MRTVLKEPPQAYAGPDPSKWESAYLLMEIAAKRTDGHTDVISHVTHIGMSPATYVETAKHSDHQFSRLSGETPMTFEVILTPEESGGFTVSCPAIPGCFSEGDTEEEALANIREAIQGCLEVRRELGMSLDSIVRHVEV